VRIARGGILSSGSRPPFYLRLFIYRRFIYRLFSYRRFIYRLSSPTASTPSAFLSPAINFFHISHASIFVMWEARSYVVSSVFCGIVSVRSQA
jgi:hypothetical protein